MRERGRTATRAPAPSRPGRRRRRSPGSRRPTGSGRRAEPPSSRSRGRSERAGPPTRGSCCPPERCARASARRERGGDDGARREARQRDVEPMSGRAARTEEDELPADRVDRDLHPAVVAGVGGGDAAPVQAQAGDRARRPVRRIRRAGASTFTGSASRARLVTGIAPAARTRSGVPELARSTNEAPQPAKPVPSAGSKLGRAFANVAGPRAAERRRRLSARVRHEQVGPEASRCPCPRTGRRLPRRRRAPRSGSRGRPDRPARRRARGRSRTAGPGPRRRRRRGRDGRRR